MKCLVFSLVFLVSAFPVAAETPTSRHVDTVAPFVDERTVGVAHVDIAALDADAVLKALGGLFQAAPGGKSYGYGPAKSLSDAVALLKKAGVADLYLVGSLADLPERAPIVVLTLSKDGDADGLLKELAAAKLFGNAQPEKFGGVIVAAAEPTLKRLKDQKPADRQELDRAFAAAGPGVAQLVVKGTADSRRILEELMPTLPREIGGGSIKVLTRGLQWIALRLDAPPKLTLHLTVQAEDKAAAAALGDLVQHVYKALGEQRQVREALPAFDRLTKLLTPEVADARLTLQVAAPALLVMLQPPVDKVRAAAQRAQALNHLKQLGLGMHVYHDATGQFPARATQDKQGNPLLSWRVQLLPYLDQDALYKQFKLDEPWDSDHNKKLIAKMPKLFASTSNPKLAADGKTTYLAPVGDNTMFPGLKGLKIRDVTDGSSNTILLVDAADDRAVIWTKPDDLAIDFKEPHKGLEAKYGSTGFLTLFVDGSARMIAKKIDPATLKALFTPAGGEVIGQLP